jgi:protein arginine kinase activator
VKCDKCKMKEADIYIGYLRQNRQKNICLCEDCSDSIGISSHIIHDFDDSSIGQDTEQLSIDSEIRCPYCSTDLVHLFSTGQTGCPQCYLVFKKEIDRYFNKYNAIADNKNQYTDVLRDHSNEFIEN